MADETAAERPVGAYPTSLGGKLFALLPQGAIFVFLIVCVIAIARARGPYGYLFWLLPMAAANVWSIRIFWRRAR